MIDKEIKIWAVAVGIIMLICGIIMFICSKSTKEDIPQKVQLDSIELERKRVEAEALENLAKQRDSIKISEIKNTISVNYYCSSPNSAGGVDFYFRYKNLTKDKTIKYISFEVGFLNEVHDFVETDLPYGGYRFGGKLTGPTKPGSSGGYGSYFDCIIYNYHAKYPVLFEIKIDYMDGSSYVIDSKYVEYVPGYRKF